MMTIRIPDLHKCTCPLLLWEAMGEKERERGEGEKGRWKDRMKMGHLDLATHLK